MPIPSDIPIEEQVVSNVTNLLLELGTGFAFMGRQYRLGDVLPEDHLKYLPTPEDLQARI